MKIYPFIPILLLLPLGVMSADKKKKAPPAEPVVEVKVVKLTLEDFGWIERDLFVELEKALDQAVPRIKRGDALAFRTFSGLKVDGQYEYGTRENFIVIQDGKERTLKMVDVPKAERMRLDVAFRVRHLELEAKATTRKILMLEGVPFPEVGSGEGKIDQKSAFALLDPVLHSRFARSQFTATGDPWLGELHASVAARMGNPESMFIYGAMLTSRSSPISNPGLGVMYLSAARDARYHEAREALTALKVDSSLQRQAEERYQQQQESDAKSFASRIEAFRQKKEKGIDPLPPLEFQEIR